MLEIITKNREYSFTFNGIKVINANNPTKIIRELFFDNIEIKIDGQKIKKENLIYINNFSKTCDFLSLSKNSFLYKKIIDLLELYPILNTKNIEKIESLINESSVSLVETSDGDMSKIINSIFSTNDGHFLFKEFLANLLKIDFYEERKLFIFDNIDYFNIDDVLSYIGVHNFIFVTNDISINITNIDQLNTVLIINNDLMYVDLDHHEQVIDYIEKQINEPITKEKFYKWIINRDDLTSIRVFEIIKKIAI